MCQPSDSTPFVYIVRNLLELYCKLDSDGSEYRLVNNGVRWTSILSFIHEFDIISGFVISIKMNLKG